LNRKIASIILILETKTLPQDLYQFHHIAAVDYGFHVGRESMVQFTTPWAGFSCNLNFFINV
jgi:hypothetical protein